MVNRNSPQISSGVADRAREYNSSATVGIIKIVFQSVMPEADLGQVSDELFASPSSISLVQTYSERQLREIDSYLEMLDSLKPQRVMETRILADILVLVVVRLSSVSSISVDDTRVWGVSVRLRLTSPLMGQTSVRLVMIRRDVEVCTTVSPLNDNDEVTTAADIERINSYAMVDESAIADGILYAIDENDVRIITYTGDVGPAWLIQMMRDEGYEVNVMAWRPYWERSSLMTFPMYMLVAGPCKV